MKKILKNTVLLIAITICTTACAENSPSVNILNAENADGFIIENTVNTEPTEEYTRTTATTVSQITADETASSVSAETILTTESATVTAETSAAATTVAKTTTASVTTPETATTPITTQETTTAPITTTESTTAAEVETPPVSQHAASEYTALNYDEVVGVWISYLELRPILEGKNETQFRADFAKMMENCKSFGINTVFVHLRAFGDAFYKSDSYPWSKYITGSLGTAPGFDPLAVMLDEAHSRNISFHGWINPMRIQSNSDIAAVSNRFKIGKWYSENSDYIARNGDYRYLNPAYDDVIKLISDGAYEIVKNYNVDGIHIDDYFYPTTSTDFDKIAFSKSGAENLASFRYDNCNRLVKSLYNTVKSANPTVLFGISPQGSIENNLNDVFADVATWCENDGYCDYIAPQIYYGFDNSAQPYKECLKKWQSMTKKSSVRLITGLAVYKIGKEDAWAGEGKNEWLDSGDILKRQIEFSRSLDDYGGIVFYSYNYMFGGYLSAAIAEELSVLDV